MKEKELAPIKETPSDFDELEKEIIRLFKKELYLPLMKELGLGNKSLAVKNSLDDLVDAIMSGRITYYRGRFTGQFGSTLSRELRRIGAEWDRKHGSFSVPQSKLPVEVKVAISTAHYRFQQVTEKIDKRLQQVSPAELAGKLKSEKFFESALWKTDKKLRASLKSITVSPQLSPAANKRISEEYTKNMQTYVQDFLEKEITELRVKVRERAEKGLRYEGLAEEIQKSYGVSQKKAKFLARQETNLLMTKFKQVRYQSAGVNTYKWSCVAGSSAHPVRPIHKSLEGKTFSWDNPPIVDEKGNRKNPGQDFGCRCFAIPIVKF